MPIYWSLQLTKLWLEDNPYPLSFNPLGRTPNIKMYVHAPAFILLIFKTLYVVERIYIAQTKPRMSIFTSSGYTAYKAPQHDQITP